MNGPLALARGIGDLAGHESRRRPHQEHQHLGRQADPRGQAQHQRHPAAEGETKPQVSGFLYAGFALTGDV